MREMAKKCNAVCYSLLRSIVCHRSPLPCLALAPMLHSSSPPFAAPPPPSPFISPFLNSRSPPSSYRSFSSGSVSVAEKVENSDEGIVVRDSNAFGHNFRDYEEKESTRQSAVMQFYKAQHINQTYEYAQKMKKEYSKLDKVEMSIWECVELLNSFIDESDPDLDEPQIQHLLQSAEAIRKDYPDEDWLHLTALIHDLGKVLTHEKFGALPQWAVVGDTYPLGCQFSDKIVHYKFFNECPDWKHPVYSTKLGVYTENCGLDKVTMTWGHDEYMFRVAKENKTTLPMAGLFIIRFHSFYALHKGGAYGHLLNEEDKSNLKWLHVFSKYDLYTKSKTMISVDEIKPYYMSLIEKYFPAKLKW